MATGLLNTRHWKQASRQYRRLHPTCEGCKRAPSVVVHHFVPPTIEPHRLLDREKCADAARRCGLVATTTPFGAKAIRGVGDGVDWAPLRGRRLCILSDADEPGERYAADFRRCASRAGAREVRIVRLQAAWASIPPGGDIADLLAERGGSEAAAVALGAEVLALAEGA